MDRAKFISVTKLVIQTNEGGYFHPRMVTEKTKAIYGDSGETMFGIDRKHGAPELGDTAAWHEFWETLDKANDFIPWEWNYRGGSLEPQLTELAAEIMHPHFERLCQKYLTPESIEIMYSDNRLLYHFSYACWNGSGWFQKFANDFNTAVGLGIRDADKLAQIAINSRCNEGRKPKSKPNPTIAKHGLKIAELFKTIDNLI